MIAPAKRVLANHPWLWDLPIAAGIGFGLVVLFCGKWVGLHSEADELAAGGPAFAKAAPRFLLPLIFMTILYCGFRASAHAEEIAHRLREPFGVLILTLSAVTIEVALVIGVMLTGSTEDDVARNTMFAVLMMIMNGLVGIALLMGGLRKREQAFNAQSTSAFLALITALTFIGLVMPRLTVSRPGGYMTPQMEIFVAGASLGVYLAFLALQSSSHRHFFTFLDGRAEEHHVAPESAPAVTRPALWISVLLLVAALVGVVLLAESLGHLLVSILARNFFPQAIQGVVIAFLILLPEGIAATRAALRSDVQRTINILHGSALSTIGLTIPAVLIVSLVLQRPIELGLNAPEIGLLAATIIVTMLNVSLGKANLMQGIIHLMFFAVWIALILG